jgi:hypothetical protein
MIKSFLALIFLIVAAVTIIRTYFRNRKSKKEGEHLIDQLKSHEINLTDFAKNYQLKFNSLKFNPEAVAIEDQQFEKIFSALEKLEKFEINYFQKIKKGEFLFMTRSYINDFVLTGSRSKKNVQHFDTYVFIVKINATGCDVHSDLPESNESKFVRMDFSKLLFARMKAIL